MSVIRLFPIMLPRVADYSKWAVIACDQFTSQPEYWRELDHYVKDAPSTLRMILPEAELAPDNSGAIARANAAMNAYLACGLFSSVEEGMILTRRTTAYGNTRLGIVTSIDLEDYTYGYGAVSPVRATEATVLERIPPRVAIRAEAPLELPHVMMLADDPDNRVFGRIKKGREVYDFDLNLGGGHVSGWVVDNAQEVAESFETLKKDSGLLFAVGDGNHSLASAKAHWDKLKLTLTESECDMHPARYALVEIVNVYDEGIRFEPIHRVVFGDVGDLVRAFVKHGKGKEAVGRITGKMDYVYLRPASAAEAVKDTDEILTEYAKTHGITVDYVHGEEEVRALCDSRGAMGILMPPMKKSELFRIVGEGGVLPRKCFSMGEAREKRYYLEAKRI